MIFPVKSNSRTPGKFLSERLYNPEEGRVQSANHSILEVYMVFSIMLWVHILSVITALGANLTYFPWLLRVEKKPEALLFTLRTIKLIDDWIANPAYVLALFTGDGLIRTAEASEGFSYQTHWIIGALVLYAIISILGLFVYSPLLKKQIKLVETTGAQTPDYKKVSQQTLVLGLLIVLITIAITFLMVVKPALW